MRSVFLDANCYLSFYKLNPTDLEELRKLVELVSVGEVRLYVTKQIRDEVRRNRTKVVRQSLDDLRKRIPGGGVPQLLRNYAEYANVESSAKTYSKRLNDLLDVVEADAASNQLHADSLIEALFNQATTLDDTGVLAAATERVLRGNPPGKPGAHGDAINWEAILIGIRNEPLELVTEDKDFRSELPDDQISAFLAHEFSDRCGSTITLHRDLSKFLGANFPHIKVAKDVVRDRAVTMLVDSPNFATTHEAIAELDRIGDFTEEQVRRMVIAARSNTQVRWVLGDADVADFYRDLISKQSLEHDVDGATVLALIDDLPPGWYEGRGPDGNDEWSGTSWEPW